ncbi:pyridoxamine 5'-phosphate oxidase family protein [Halogeometricum borinquense]|uniref:Pyridoxamine 5'-phosphate oxidase family protein n=1 Tax=Halogeometricum borinquense TaxID=60847 RepID=A0A6C0UF33_9EURY|nr:pyridoxamine 5'-phosphate oxidase family protein [Halogeometricum borinquense]QIB73163.1 pyridoxamine 5'-phosphate oxidase family protein [Halogeometricum borinquense]QIQ77441.1 pyridoxamine 5'-phosphate oxidase family protein [Halogeometricum borinquense]
MSPTNVEGFEPIQGNPMTDEEVDAFLREHGVGVLALTDGERAYGVPISFGYDGENLYFVFLRGETSRKEEFAEKTAEATLTVFDVAGRYEWQSVIVSGTIRPVEDDEWDAVVSAMEANAWFPSLFSESEPMRGIGGWTLDIAEATGLRNRP